MPRYLIHVGPHKTGTTYLQLRFDAARERLRHSGVAYPIEWSAGPRSPSHQKLLPAIRAANVRHLSSMFKQIARSGVEDVLISAEDLNLLEQKELGYLREALGGDPAVVIFYLRRWSELLPSLWQERVKHGLDETFPEFFATHISKPLASPVLNFAHELDKYARVFGRENVRIVSYSNVCDDGLDLAEHFFDTFLPKHRAVLDGLPSIASARPNTSLPMIDIEVMRALNSFHAMSGGETGPELREWYLAHARQLDLSELFAAIGSNMQTLQFSDGSAAVARLHGEVLTGYPGQMVAPVRDGRLFDPQVHDISFAQPRYLMNRAAHAALEGVYAAFAAASRAAHDGSRAPLEMDARKEPGLDDPFEEAIDEALKSLPADLRAAISNIAIVVEDEPPYGRLLGLFRGAPLARRGSNPSGVLPAKVSIFRGPITRLAAGDADRLRREVKHVVLHELGHYFETE